jgi:hypothetical protein
LTRRTRKGGKSGAGACREHSECGGSCGGGLAVKRENGWSGVRCNPEVRLQGDGVEGM